MYCAACNLNYSGRLNFCRRCGQSLVYSSSDPITDTYCCTRCGARSTKGENLCRQCGVSAESTAQEAVVGACYHCGSSWRGGWLFCKTCGIDRDHALLLPTSMPGDAKPTGEMASPEELQEIAKESCKRCGATAKPFSRYCETCGNTLGLSNGDSPNKPDRKEEEQEEDQGPITGKLNSPPMAAAFRTQADLPTGLLQSSLSKLGQRLPEPFVDQGRAGLRKAPVNDSLKSDYRSATGPLPSKPAKMKSEKKTRAVEESTSRGKTEQLVERSDSRGAILVWIIISTLGLGAGLVAWRLWTNEKNLSRSTRQAPEPSNQQPAIKPLASTGQTSPNITVPKGMVFVPGGSFKMGRDDGDVIERPAHIVTLKPFFIDRTEVTNEEYLLFISEMKRQTPAHWIGGKIPKGQLKYQVINVTWSDADAYARWAKKRLPTEAEWEFAARGMDGRIYPWGNQWKPDHANAAGKDGRLLEIGHFLAGASPFGALDMCGNVWEWTASDLKKYPGGRIPTSLFPKTELKVIRGGAYDATLKSATTTHRGAVSPDRIYDKTGFRCARDAR